MTDANVFNFNFIQTPVTFYINLVEIRLPKIYLSVSPSGISSEDGDTDRKFLRKPNLNKITVTSWFEAKEIF
jgi:hypothetical protein